MPFVRPVPRSVGGRIGRFVSGVSAYGAAGLEPVFVADMTRDYYRSTSRQTFDDIFTTSRLGNATMVDSDGLLKWAPHNLALNSATPATQSITVVSGADYTVECTGSGSITLSGAGTGTVTEGNPVEITASTTSLTLTVTGSVDLMWCYRSDLGGMAPVPADARVAGSTTYVPTTSTAKYLPRRHNHVYNGSAWVDAGTLVETEARTNLITYSEDFTDASWTVTSSTVTSGATGPDGNASAYDLNGISGSGESRLNVSVTVATSTAYTFSIFAKSDQVAWVSLAAIFFTTPANSWAYFDLSSGSVGTVDAGLSASIEDCGNGWYRCAITFTTDAADTSGELRVYIAEGDNDRNLSNQALSSILIYGAQFEEGSTPSSYIPTSGSTVTRAADTNGLLVDGSIVPWGSAVCIQTSGRMTYADTSAINEIFFAWWQADANTNILSILSATGAETGRVIARQTQGGTLDQSISPATTYSPGINVPFNIASRHGSTFVNVAVDGTALTADNTPTSLPDLSSADLKIGLKGFLNISTVRVWTVDIGDAGIAEASS